MRKLTKEQRDEMRRRAQLDMNEAHYLTYRGSMEAILTALDDLDSADAELDEVRGRLKSSEGMVELFMRSTTMTLSDDFSRQLVEAKADAIMLKEDREELRAKLARAEKDVELEKEIVRQNNEVIIEQEQELKELRDKLAEAVADANEGERVITNLRGALCEAQVKLAEAEARLVGRAERIKVLETYHDKTEHELAALREVELAARVYRNTESGRPAEYYGAIHALDAALAAVDALRSKT